MWQVVMLDSDNLPLRNPEYLFQSREYLSSGSLFFSDWWDILEWVKPEAYTAFGLQFPGFAGATLAAESGQLLLNRSATPGSTTEPPKFLPGPSAMFYAMYEEETCAALMVCTKENSQHARDTISALEASMHQSSDRLIIRRIEALALSSRSFAWALTSIWESVTLSPAV